MFKSELHGVFTEEVNEIALSFNDNKRLQLFSQANSYILGISVGTLCRQELLHIKHIKTNKLNLKDD